MLGYIEGRYSWDEHGSEHFLAAYVYNIHFLRRKTLDLGLHDLLGFLSVDAGGCLVGCLSAIPRSLRRSYLLALCCYLCSCLDNHVPRCWTFDRTDLLGYWQFGTYIHNSPTNSCVGA